MLSGVVNSVNQGTEMSVSWLTLGTPFGPSRIGRKEGSFGGEMTQKVTMTFLRFLSWLGNEEERGLKSANCLSYDSDLMKDLMELMSARKCLNLGSNVFVSSSIFCPYSCFGTLTKTEFLRQRKWDKKSVHVHFPLYDLIRNGGQSTFAF